MALPGCCLAKRVHLLVHLCSSKSTCQIGPGFAESECSSLKLKPILEERPPALRQWQQWSRCRRYYSGTCLNEQSSLMAARVRSVGGGAPRRCRRRRRRLVFFLSAAEKVQRFIRQTVFVARMADCLSLPSLFCGLLCTAQRDIR